MIDTCIHEDHNEEEEEIIIAECFIDDDMELCDLKSYHKDENNVGDKEEEEENLTLVADLIAVGVIAGSEIENIADMDDGKLDLRSTNINNHNNNNDNGIDNKGSIPSAVAMVVSEKGRGGGKGKGIGKQSGKDLSNDQKLDDSTRGNNGLKCSNEKIKNLGGTFDAVAVAVAVPVEFTEDNITSESEINDSTKSDLILESDPEPVILEAETVISVPRTLSKSKNRIPGGEEIDINNENQKNISEKNADNFISESNKIIMQRDVNREVEKEVEEGVMHEFLENTNKCPPVEFLMSWNRRIAESSIFFDLMIQAGFLCEHKGKCVYSFTVLNK